MGWLIAHTAYLSYVTGPLAAFAMRAVGWRRTWAWLLTAGVQVGVSTIVLGLTFLGVVGLEGLLFQTVPCFIMSVSNYVDWKRADMPPLPARLLPTIRRRRFVDAKASSGVQ
jgi:hypothetical protein